MVGGSSTSYPSSTRSSIDKEKTKMRERQRRAITTKIFQGLRRHGGYHLSPRADINEVLRQLAKEAGWVIEPDGTTFRCKLLSRCPTCGATPNQSAAATPTTSSTVIATSGSSGALAGGDCSTAASPHRTDPAMMINNNNIVGTASAASPTTFLCVDDCSGVTGAANIPLAFYVYGGLHHPTTTGVAVGGATTMTVPSHQTATYAHEARASNQNAAVGLPLHHTT